MGTDHLNRSVEEGQTHQSHVSIENDLMRTSYNKDRTNQNRKARKISSCAYKDRFGNRKEMQARSPRVTTNIDPEK